MRNSEIKLNIQLGDEGIDKIHWDATEKPTAGQEETKAVLLSIWDHEQQNTLRMDLWTKEMSIDEMKRFTVNAIGGLGDTIKNATNDGVMSEKIHQLCQELVKHIEEERKENGEG